MREMGKNILFFGIRFIFRLLKSLIDRGDEQFRGIAVILTVDETFGCLVDVDLTCNGIQSRLHKRVHGGSGFTQVVQRNRGDAILLNIDLHIEGLVAEGDCGGIDAGNVASIFSGNGGLGRRFLRRIILPGAEHDQKHHEQNNGERKKNSGVNHFFHM